MELGGEFFDPHLPAPAFAGRAAFLRAVQRIEPAVPATLLSDVFPAYGTPVFSERAAKWQREWNLVEDWVYEHVDDLASGYFYQDLKYQLMYHKPGSGFFAEYRPGEEWQPRGFELRARGLYDDEDDYVILHPEVAGEFAPAFRPWNPLDERRKSVRARLRAEFERQLESYLEGVEDRARQAGFVRSPTKRTRHTGAAEAHFDWLALYRVKGMSFGKIASMYEDTLGVTPQTVREAVRATAGLIGLDTFNRDD